MLDPNVPDVTSTESLAGPSRRVFLLAVGAFLTGCTSGQRSADGLPGPAWDRPQPAGASPNQSYAITPAPDQPSRTTTAAPTPGPTVAGVIARTQWSSGQPNYRNMNRMTPVRYITIHHDANRFTSTDPRATARRIEGTRRYHRESNGWGDIGYHYVVDRAGRVWDARPVGWQGAHVKNHNEGNIGIVCLGNFEVQQPTQAQVDAAVGHVRGLMKYYGVPRNRVLTHREWSSTLCPGRSLQASVDRSRRNGQIA